ncbi:hypothetical protein D3C78_1926260 [compost metagenome]
MAKLAQAVVGLVKIQIVVFVVAGHEHHGRGPAVAGGIAAQAEIVAGQLGPLAV